MSARFWAKTDRSGGDSACWPWLRATVRGGYGYFRWGNRMGYAHRVAWELVRGAIPDGMRVLHRCDNPPCCNPAHLFLGTHADNMADRQAKRRQVRGESHGGARLTIEDVVAIRSRYASGDVTQAELGQVFGISHQQVSRIIRREKWKAET